ncbi:MAG: hypothetical protein JEZ04_20690 [Spirochaetales bacterium]|nr:hypothetical protein [Spirochaetales bacterium]
MKKIIIIIFFLCFYISQAAVSDESDNIVISHHAIGLGFGFSQELDSVESSYSFPAGMSLFYQFTGPSSFPLLLGFSVTGYGFSPLEDYFNTSFMLVPLLSAGFGLLMPLFPESSIGIYPVIRYGQYFRTFNYDNQDYWGSRPVFSAGIEFLIFTETNMCFSIDIFYSIFFDDQQIHLLTYGNRSGYVF